MNIINDYSSYHWTCLLRAKSDVAWVLCEWLEVAEIQSGERLCYLVTNNGELRSHDMACWCAEWGITQQFTAPLSRSMSHVHMFGLVTCHGSSYPMTLLSSLPCITSYDLLSPSVVFYRVLSLTYKSATTHSCGTWL